MFSAQSEKSQKFYEKYYNMGGNRSSTEGGVREGVSVGREEGKGVGAGVMVTRVEVGANAIPKGGKASGGGVTKSEVGPWAFL